MTVRGYIPVRQNFGETEVSNLHMTFNVQKEVLRFQVSVHDLKAVEVR